MKRIVLTLLAMLILTPGVSAQLTCEEANINTMTGSEFVVNIQDLAMIALVFGLSSSDIGFDSVCDVNNDEDINVIDLALVSVNIGCGIDLPCTDSGEDDYFVSGQFDCNQCDHPGDDDGDQSWWDDPAADDCDSDCGIVDTTVLPADYQSPETSCFDSIDNDCDGESDHDTQDGRHGDSDCPVSITGISVSDKTPNEDNTITVSCESSVAGVNSILAGISSACTYVGCSGDSANFTCTDTSSNPFTITIEYDFGVACSLVDWDALASSVGYMACVPYSCTGSTVDFTCTEDLGNPVNITLWDYVGSCASIDWDVLASALVRPCSWASWVGNTASFTCNTGDTTGLKMAGCYVNRSRSYKIGSEYLSPIRVYTSDCVGYGDPTGCNNNPNCEWCYSCNNNQYSNGIDRCVDEGNCVYSCEADPAQCSATCDLDTVPCPDTECDNLDSSVAGCYSGTWRDYSDESNDCQTDCSCESNPCTTYTVSVTDADGDGYDTECDGDCDDNPGACGSDCHPGADELCDGYDNDCDGDIDEECITTCNSCAACTSQIQSASPGDTIQLTADITGVNSVCVDFDGTDGVTFDCDGHSITGDGGLNGIGIRLTSGSDNNVIRNCPDIHEVSIGIDINSSDSNLIEDVHAYSNEHYGLRMHYGESNTVRDSTFDSNEVNDFDFHAWYTSECSNSLVNVVGSGGRPIGFYNSGVNLQNQVFSSLVLCNADGSNLNNVDIQGSASYRNNGFYMEFTDSSTISGMDCISNRQIDVYVSDYNTFSDITVTDSETYGITMQSSDYNTFQNSQSTGSTQAGLYVGPYSEYNDFIGMSLGNTNGGMIIDRSGGTTLRDSTITSCNGPGVNIFNEVTHPTSYVYNNIFDDNNEDVRISSTSDVELNTALDCGAGPNIVGGSCMGGNFWGDSSGTGFSETCTDSDSNGICDSSYTPVSGQTDYYPLTFTSSCTYSGEHDWFIDGEPDCNQCDHPGDDDYDQGSVAWDMADQCDSDCGTVLTTVQQADYEGSTETSCYDSIDNDCDGATDFYDLDCSVLCGNTGENDWFILGQPDCNQCDHLGDDDDDQGGWMSEYADPCDVDCGPAATTVHYTDYQLTETRCDLIDNDCDGTVDEGCGEICDNPGDEDSNGQSDYDDLDGLHGDEVCPVAITGISVSDTTPDEYTTVEVYCTPNVFGVNSVEASLGGTPCTFTEWEGSSAKFSCDTGAAGTKTAVCSIDTAKSYQSGSDRTMSVTVETALSCGNTGEDDWFVSGQPDCNQCDYLGDNDGDQGSPFPPSLWLDQCDSDCGIVSTTVLAADYEATETSCDGIDNDCDGTVDEGCGGEICGNGVDDDGDQGLWSHPMADTCDSDCGPVLITVYPGGGYQAQETSCSDGLDNDCNGRSDYDSQDGLPGDYPACVVSITDMSVSDKTPSSYDTIEVSCTSSVGGINSVVAGVTPACTYVECSGNSANFTCTDTNNNPYAVTIEHDFGGSCSLVDWDALAASALLSTCTVPFCDSGTGTVKFSCTELNTGNPVTITFWNFLSECTRQALASSPLFNPCSFTGWSGNVASFDCNAGVDGMKYVGCYINTSRSYDDGNYNVQTISVGASSGLTTCSSCADCTDAIQSASPGDTIQLSNDITAVGAMTCVDFAGTDGVTLDCDGHSITGDGTSNGYGIRLNSGSDNNVIRNCPNINNHMTGILISYSDGNLIEDVQASSNTDEGLWINYGESNTVRDSSFQENQIFDFEFRASSTSECSNSLVNVVGSGGNPIGFYSSGVNLQDQVFSGLVLCNADSSNLDNVDIQGSATHRNNLFSMLFTDSSTISGMDCISNYGILIEESDYNTFSDITVTDSVNGFHISRSEYNTFQNSQLTNNIGEDINLYISDYNEFTGMTLGYSNDIGMHIYNSGGITLTDSTIAYSWRGIHLQNLASAHPTSYIYNNIFDDNTADVTLIYSTPNIEWNAPLDCGSGPNIVGGSCMGGNFWGNSEGTGFSETCTDSNSDGICDSSYTPVSGQTDYYPLISAFSCGSTEDNYFVSDQGDCNQCDHPGDDDGDQGLWSHPMADTCDSDCGTVLTTVQPADYQDEETFCSDGIDNNCDGDTDFDDGTCIIYLFFCGLTGEHNYYIPGESECNQCDHPGDDDQDQGRWSHPMADQCDSDCGTVLTTVQPDDYEGSTETSCSDGIDNDCDGGIDSEDSDCGGSVNGCNSCASCTAALSLANPGDTILLTDDITAVGAMTCVDFAGTDGVTLDCDGHSITGDGTSNGYGIRLNSGSDNNVIRNCPNINNHMKGIEISYSDGNLIEDIQADSNYVGLSIFNGISNTVRDSTFQESHEDDFEFLVSSSSSTSECSNSLVNVIGSGGNPIGFYSSGVNLQDQVFSGLVLCDADGSNLDNVDIQGSATHPNNRLWMLFTDSSTISGMDIDGRMGLEIISSNYNTFSDMTVTNNFWGINLHYSDYNTIQNSQSTGNTQPDIRFWHSDYNDLTGMTLGSSQAGVSINKSGGITLKDSTITSCSVEGIVFLDVDSSHPTSYIYNNIFDDNAVDVISDSSTPNTVWNAPLDCGSGPNIVGGSCMGGNFWGNSWGTGFSETCTDSNSDGICDSSYTPVSGQTDYYPLT